MRVTSDAPVDPGAPPPMLAGRYRLGERLGAGGAGAVYLAEDLLTGRTVAAKVLRPASPIAIERLRREILALQVLQIPGVARLLDHGTQDGRAFILMDYVRGAPFPGPAGSEWATLVPTVVLLLETLAGMHALGVVHRDLKPANVLVDDDGRPTVLDLGLARGAALGSAITTAEGAVGTPNWQAPEQMLGAAVDGRADLYALGVMLYEALAGQPPHPTGDLRHLYWARVMRDAPPLAWVAPHVPADAARLVDQLLSRLPERRPRTAADVLARLRGAPSEGMDLPRLGDPRVVGAVADALLQGRPVDVAGREGVGRTRLLRDVADELARRGRAVGALVRGQRPYQSLAPLCGTPPAGQDSATVAEVMERRLAAALGSGRIVLVDDVELLDPWSAAVVARARGTGPLLTSWREPPPGALMLSPLTEAELRPLFAGPDRLLHLREDAARELYSRTAGVPARVTTEIAGWLGAQLATWTDGRVVVERAALDRLAAGLRPGAGAAPPAASLPAPMEDLLAWITLAWPNGTPTLLAEATGLAEWELRAELDELTQAGAITNLEGGRVVPRCASRALQDWPEARRADAHTRLAAALLPGAPGRLAHLLAAADVGGAAVEARLVGRALLADGYAGRAIAVLTQGLEAARQVGDRATERAILLDLALAAAPSPGRGPLEHVLYELRRTDPADEMIVAARDLHEALLARQAGDVAGAAERWARVPRLDAEDLLPLEGQRLSLQLWLDRRGVQVGAPTDLAAWAERYGGLARFLAGRWRALELNRHARFAEAAQAHLSAAASVADVGWRLIAQLDGAAAWMEAGNHGDAGRIAGAARAAALDRRLSALEARAEWILRGAAARAGAPPEPDLELVEAAEHLHAPWILSRLAMQEAVFAWRAGSAELAGTLAAGAARAGRGSYALLGRALGVALSGVPDETLLSELDRLAPWHAVQVVGLVARGLGASPALAALALGFADRVPAPLHADRRDALSVTEAVALATP